MTDETAKRSALLVILLGLAALLVACGRASQSDIFAAVGITPTPTSSAEEIVAATEAAIAQQTAAAAAAASPGAQVAAVGDVNRGRTVFTTWCLNCHRPGGGGSAQDLLVPGSDGATLTHESLTVLLREAPEHAPGPYRTSDISDRQVGDLLAYILAEASS